MPATAPAQIQTQAVAALPHWRAVDFISDLHLQASEPLTITAWQRYMMATSADAVFILGDLFEAWVGDDAAEPGGDVFETKCAAILRQTASRVPVFFMRGNRDFLVGPSLMVQCGCTLLDDPAMLIFGGQRWLLSHGDAMCLADTEYLRFRATVRNDAWQQIILAKPIAERRAIARMLRNESEARTQSTDVWFDVDTDAAIAALRSAGASHLIHGHTHRPADHDLAPGLQRMVLSDWDLTAAKPRAEVLRLTVTRTEVEPETDTAGYGVDIRRIDPSQA